LAGHQVGNWGILQAAAAGEQRLGDNVSLADYASDALTVVNDYQASDIMVPEFLNREVSRLVLMYTHNLAKILGNMPYGTNVQHPVLLWGLSFENTVSAKSRPTLIIGSG